MRSNESLGWQLQRADVSSEEGLQARGRLDSAYPKTYQWYSGASKLQIVAQQSGLCLMLVKCLGRHRRVLGDN
jgi:hypothetical protein